MYDYFRVLKDTADEDVNDYNIADITKKLAVDAGYHRVIYTLKNGKQKERTEYCRPFNNILTAKWLLTYKRLFILKLYKQKDIEEYHVQIINDTFIMFMNRLQLDKLADSGSVNKYVYMTLISRITQTRIEVGSLSRIQLYNSGSKKRFRDCKVINRVSCSYEEMLDKENFFDIEDTDTSNMGDFYIIMELKSKLIDNPYGIRLLEAMLNSRKHICLSRIDLYVNLKDSEKTEETKKMLLKAWNTIVSTLKVYSLNTTNRRYVQARAIHFSDEV